ncbi:nitroreductase family protein [Candidatus Woesearchaeota archaeon]|nr:nitroreductase family protein [Candidatus Woesearchaeota archaeon]
MQEMEKAYPLIELIKTRRSIRKYQDRMVEWDKIVEVLDAGRYAPSAGNLQNWKFIVVTDEGSRKALAEASMQQYWMEQAPVHIVVCGLSHHAVRFYGIRGDKLYTIQNNAAAAMNMLLMAHALGLGACWVGAFDEDRVKSILNIYEYARPHIIITLGYPDEEVPVPEREPIYKNFFMNRYDARIKDIDAVMRDVSKVIWGRASRAKKATIKSSKKLGTKIKESIFGRKKSDFERYTDEQQDPKNRWI